MELYDRKFSEIYKTIKLKDKELYFRLDYNIYSMKYNKLVSNIKINIKITYLALFENNKIIETLDSFNEWELTGNDNSARLENCIDIRTKYQSFGIGSFVLSKLLKIANDYIPEYSLYGTLGKGDEYGENTLRRNTLYKSAGFIVSEKSITIEKVKFLNISREFSYIQKINDKELFILLVEKEKEITSYEKDKRKIQNKYDFLNQKFESAEKYSITITKGFWILFLFSLLMIYYIVKYSTCL